MSLPDFTKAMDAVLKGTDFETVKAAGIELICAELGKGVPGYLPVLERFGDRLDELAPKREATVPGEAL